MILILVLMVTVASCTVLIMNKPNGDISIDKRSDLPLSGIEINKDSIN